MFLNKVKRLLEIPEPHRSGMIRRTIRARYPSRITAGSARIALKLDIRACQRFTGSEGPRFLATTAHRIAGIGHALSEYNTGLILARAFDLEFLHSSLASPWEEFLGFSSGFQAVEPFWKKGGFELVKLPYIDWTTTEPAETLKEKVAAIRSEKPLLFMPFDGQNSLSQHSTGKELRKIYWSYKDRKGDQVLREPGAVNVAVHIRRRNAMDMKNPAVHDPNSAGYKSRYIDLDYFASLMQLITEALPDEQVVFHLFSQGAPEGFEPLQKFSNVRLHLDVDQYNTFHNMACADILITSPSSFSFKAGMLTPGLKLTRHPWWHEVPQDAEWCRVPEDPANEADKILEFIKENFQTSRLNSKNLFPFSL